MTASPRQPGWPLALGLALLIVIAYFFIATRTTLFDRDEPRFSSAAVEMVRSGNWLYPTFNGKLRPDKPILIYWLMAPAVKALGAIEAAVRLPSVLAAGGTALLVFWLGRRLFDARTGLLAAAILATCPLMLMIGSAATADSVLLFTLTACLCIWADALLRGQMSQAHVLLLGLGLGAAQLTKGPVGVAIPLLGILTSRAILQRPWRKWRRPRGEGANQAEPGIAVDPAPGVDAASIPGLRGVAFATLIGLSLFILWGVPANNATNGEFLRVGIGRHVIDRTLTPQESHGGNWFLTLPYYLPILVLMFFPWTLFLLGSASALLGGRLGDARVRALLVGWVVPTFILMSVVSTKLPHYILPIFPALALAVAATVRSLKAPEGESRLNQRDRTLLHRGGMLFTPILVGGVIAAGALWCLPASLYQSWPGLELLVPPLRVPTAILAAMALAFGLPALVLHLQWRFAAAARLLLPGMASMLLILGAMVLPEIEAIKPSAAIANTIRLHTDEHVPVASCDYGEPSFNFYMGRPPIEYLHVPDVEEWSRRPGPGVLVISRADLDAAYDTSTPLRLEQIGHATGLGNSRMRLLDLLIVGRNLHEAERPATQPR